MSRDQAIRGLIARMRAFQLDARSRASSVKVSAALSLVYADLSALTKAWADELDAALSQEQEKSK